MIVDWAIDLPIFFITSILLSSVGLGGGAFYVPLLLALGYAFPEASATSLFLITVTGFLAFSRFRRARLVDWQLAVVMDVFTDLGAFVGGYTAIQFQPHWLKLAFGFFLVIASVFILRILLPKSKKDQPLRNQRPPLSRRLYASRYFMRSRLLGKSNSLDRQEIQPHCARVQTALRNLQGAG